MKTHGSSFALRQTREHLASRNVVLAMLGTSILLGLSGPFETFEALPLLPRVAYWAVIVFVTYCTAITVINLVQTLLPETWPNLLRDGIAGSCAGPILAVIVTVINAMTFTANTADLPSFQTLLLYTTIIAATVSILIGMAFGNTEPHSANESSDQTPPLFKRLPFDKRGPIVSLQAQDHYVLVTTTAGQELVLIRIADAMAEVGSTAGFQTHRSHWVAQDQIASSKRLGERGTLFLKSGAEVPVSRSFMPALKEAGYFL